MRIAVVHDFFRSDPLLPGLGQNADAAGQRLMSLVGPPLQALGHEVLRLTELRSGQPSPLLTLARRHGWPLELRTWTHAFSDPAYARQIEPMLAAMQNFDLVIGWEMTPNMRRYLSAKRIKFLDVGLDPVRFAPDLFLRIRSNEPRLADRLAEQAVPDAPLIEQAAARRARLPSPPVPQAPAVVFAAQREIDADRVIDGELAHVDPFIPAIAASLRPGQTLLLHPHPDGAPHSDVRTLHAAFPQARVSDDDLHGLLAAPWVERVVTLSSGVADEAALFGTPATRLIVPDDAAERGPLEFARAFRIDSRASTQRFWSAILSRSRHVHVPPEPPARPLRDLLSDESAPPVRPSERGARAIRPGDDIAFGTGAPGMALCVVGWSTPEEWGVWSDGGLATLLVEPQGAPRGLLLELHLTAFVPGPDKPMHFDLSVRPAGHQRSMSLASDDVPPLVVELSPALCRGEGPVEMAFRFDNLATPASLGRGTDHRRLGVGLRRLLVRAP